MRLPTYEQAIELHRRLIAQSGGLPGLRDRHALESALAQPAMSFGGQSLYPTVIDKAGGVGVLAHHEPCLVGGNKRVGHAVMELVLTANGFELSGTVDEREVTVLAVAAGRMSRDEFRDWIRACVLPHATPTS
jgi:death-on-curing protein